MRGGRLTAHEAGSLAWNRLRHSRSNSTSVQSGLFPVHRARFPDAALPQTPYRPKRKVIAGKCGTSQSKGCMGFHAPARSSACPGLSMWVPEASHEITSHWNIVLESRVVHFPYETRTHPAQYKNGIQR